MQSSFTLFVVTCSLPYCSYNCGELLLQGESKMLTPLRFSGNIFPMTENFLMKVSTPIVYILYIYAKLHNFI